MRLSASTGRRGCRAHGPALGTGRAIFDKARIAGSVRASKHGATRGQTGHIEMTWSDESPKSVRVHRAGDSPPHTSDHPKWPPPGVAERRRRGPGPRPGAVTRNPVAPAG